MLKLKLFHTSIVFFYVKFSLDVLESFSLLCAQSETFHHFVWVWHQFVLCCLFLFISIITQPVLWSLSVCSISYMSIIVLYCKGLCCYDPYCNCQQVYVISVASLTTVSSVNVMWGLLFWNAVAVAAPRRWADGLSRITGGWLVLGCIKAGAAAAAHTSKALLLLHLHLLLLLHHRLLLTAAPTDGRSSGWWSHFFVLRTAGSVSGAT